MIDLSQAPLAGVTAVGDKLFAAIFEFSSNIDNNNSIQYLIYNYKRNNFYPFIPIGQKNRDTEQEMKILSGGRREVKFKKDMAFWYPVWDLSL